MKNNKKPARIKKSLFYSYIDGVFASVMVGLRDTFITPFAIALGAATAQVGLLSSLPNLVASLAQIKSADVTEKLRSRKKVISFSVFIHAVLFLPILLIPFFLQGKNTQINFLIFFYILHLSFGNFSAPPWGSLISKYIPANKRGKYFGFRNKTLGFITVASAFIGSFILQGLSQFNLFLGYAVLFFVALVSRLISWHYLNKMYEPPFRVNEDAQFSFFEFVATIKKSNFTRFVFYVAAMNFCVYIASPFFAVYILRDLRMNYPAYTLVTMAATMTILLATERWGSRADIFGNIKVIRTCSFFVPFVPMLWIFSSNIFYLIVIQIVAGFFWSGFNIATSNFIFDSVSPAKRTRCIAYFNVITGTAMFLGASVGGYAAAFLPNLFGYRLLTLFFVSGLIRIFIAAFSFLLKEVRPVRHTTGFRLLQETIGFSWPQ
ncbi:MAG: MFS transporter [Candidatus Omnitrophica bacterium]|nr:MFS transporter [Candidatus Omnitrophota bacterium]